MSDEQNEQSAQDDFQAPYAPQFYSHAYFDDGSLDEGDEWDDDDYIETEYEYASYHTFREFLTWRGYHWKARLYLSKLRIQWLFNFYRNRVRWWWQRKLRQWRRVEEDVNDIPF